MGLPDMTDIIVAQLTVKVQETTIIKGRSARRTVLSKYIEVGLLDGDPATNALSRCGRFACSSS